MCMSSPLRAPGARAGHRALRILLLAAAGPAGTALLLAACSAPQPTSAGSGSGSVHAPAGRPLSGAERQAAGGRAFDRAGLTLSAQSIIYTAYLTVRVKNVPAAATAAAGIATAAGGYVADEHQMIPPGSRQVPQASLELKIPVAQYEAALAKLSSPAIGRKLGLSRHAVDVTQQVADVSSRVASARAAIAQLRALLKRAGSVSALLSVTEEINSQESNLEALEAQQRALAHQTSYATVSVTLLGHHAEVVSHRKKIPGFAAGLRGGWHALGVVVGWLLTALGSLLPFLVPAALLAGLALAVRRWLARRKAPPAADPPAAAAP